MNVTSGHTTVRIVGIAVAAMGLGIAGLPLALSASATPAQHVPVGVCHATSSDSNPFQWIVVDDDSVQLAGHQMHRDEPNKTWKAAGTWNGVAHQAGDAKADYIQGVDGEVTEAWCLADAQAPVDNPTDEPTDNPSDNPTDETSEGPTDEPSEGPSDNPSDNPTEGPSEVPTDEPTATDVKSQSQGPASIPSTGGRPAELAHTGSSTGFLLGLGGGLLATGVVFLAAGRKPENA